MKALIYDGPEQLDYRDCTDPQPQDGEKLVQVESVGICGSDMHAYLGHDERRPAPLILGHEVAGTEVDTGKRVTINPLVTCGTCKACRQGRDNLCPTRQIISMPPREGGFAEQVVLPQSNLIAVPDHISSDQAALVEPIACGWHGVRLARALAGDDARALVIGGGAIGVAQLLVWWRKGVHRYALSSQMISGGNISRRRAVSTPLIRRHSALKINLTS